MTNLWNKHKVKIGAFLVAFGTALEAGTGALEALLTAIQGLF